MLKAYGFQRRPAEPEDMRFLIVKTPEGEFEIWSNYRHITTLTQGEWSRAIAFPRFKRPTTPVPIVQVPA